MSERMPVPKWGPGPEPVSELVLEPGLVPVLVPALVREQGPELGLVSGQEWAQERGRLLANRSV